MGKKKLTLFSASRIVAGDIGAPLSETGSPFSNPISM